jgi:hypothetical protein
MDSTIHNAARFPKSLRLPFPKVLALGVIAAVAFELFVTGLARKFLIKERKP